MNIHKLLDTPVDEIKPPGTVSTPVCNLCGYDLRKASAAVTGNPYYSWALGGTRLTDDIFLCKECHDAEFESPTGNEEDY